jgi:hypothetical protein
LEAIVIDGILRSDRSAKAYARISMSDAWLKLSIAAYRFVGVRKPIGRNGQVRWREA